MKTIITEVGLKLAFDQEHSELENFYHQLFGRWPTEGSTNIAKENIEILRKLCRSLDDNGKSVIIFFKLVDDPGTTPKQSNKSDEDYLLNVKDGLQRLRNDYAKNILLIYGEDIDVSAAQLYDRVQDLEHELEDYRRSMTERQTLLEQSIDILKLHEDVSLVLRRANILTISKLLSHTIDEIKNMTDIGPINFISIAKALAAIGLFLPADQGGDKK